VVTRVTRVLTITRSNPVTGDVVHSGEGRATPSKEARHQVRISSNVQHLVVDPEVVDMNSSHESNGHYGVTDRVQGQHRGPNAAQLDARSRNREGQDPAHGRRYTPTSEVFASTRHEVRRGIALRSRRRSEPDLHCASTGLESRH
jgi:hypothetical protein